MAQAAHKLIIITAPSGAGKTSITRYLLEKYPLLSFSVSAATRTPRGKEQDGIDYHFISEEAFKAHIAADDFLEYEMVYEGKYYGTLKAEMNRIWALSKIPMLDIDVKGAMKVQQQYSNNCLSIFIKPPSIEALKSRLENRGTETPESLEMRLNKASFELSFQENFNCIITNDNLLEACIETETVIKDFLGW
ncbi:MAG: guanylate kinase [Sediminibacterium sp.]